MMMTKDNCSEQSGWDAVKCIWDKYSALWLVPAFILGITVGFAIGYSVTNQYTFVESMIPEIVGIGISITGIYYLEQWRQGRVEEARLKEELLWQAKSQSNETAKSAIDRIRYKGWLTGEDGLLVGANLSIANLVGSHLTSANLKGAELGMTILAYSHMGAINLENADLTLANLNNTDLSLANLQGAKLIGVEMNDSILNLANMTNANLKGAKFINADLRGATLPDGTEWTPLIDMSRFTDPKHPEYWTPDIVPESQQDT